ncbi:putative RNA binding protein YcfA (HicA-like mRNA interferase family) [Caldicellulosiruptor bescii]|uniref:YcfA family protein n=2 Tax=Caldicellulosiruptor bescii TaxID=31899 RepID=B9MLA0_CALBD|nr:type II toxin-antitoxin system HicA family toxin [Caldicellulosiruptor bescii]ACM61090.1 YcfA family protein [Caldicellulosiruptor bescii DSM 6725]PBC89096.1 putative RNA binding protein YcfA (HicA-like mRNA interferase family) [Caldicellulosiruptor bescii]PBC91422.1 putative RNA binding protein YcfA (HicA-like mRNA interferase family) [Caldicellulosiruptor bescii]PBD03167.1 putative RNA binding protein YcfA (HicA-like mRNA interferase family) [Caldicellulosiruptor bescii]PBD07220.1 putativ
MSSKYPVLKPQEIIRALKKLGFEEVSQRGSHLKLKRENPTRIVIVPIHEEVARGTLKSILEQAGISLEEFLQLL